MPLRYAPSNDVEPAPPPRPERPPPRRTQNFEFAISRGGESLVMPCMRQAGSPWWVGDGIEGLDMPEIRLVSERAAGMWGGLARDLDVPQRRVFLPIGLAAGDLQTMLDERDRFDRLTSPLDMSPVRVTVVRPDGTERWIEGRVDTDPRTWDASTLTVPIGRLRFGLSLICDNPWWRGDQEPVSWSPDAGRGGFFPLLPVRLRSGRVIGQDTPVFVRGDAPMWPRWSISGPAESVTATHVESGRSWTLHGQFGQSVTPIIVDTDPRVAMTTGLQVATPGGSQRWSWMQPPFDLWPLPPGDQTVSLEIVGASPTTEVIMYPRPNYRAA